MVRFWRMMDGRCRVLLIALLSAAAFASCSVDSGGTGAGFESTGGSFARGGFGGSAGSAAAAGSGGASFDASDASGGACGDLGEACCSGDAGPVCYAGACSPHGVCGVFGGAYQTVCGSSTVCSVPDPFGGCNCPAGFANAVNLNVGCSDASSESEIDICYASPGDAGPSGDWAGAYESANTDKCGVQNNCLVGNPYTGGACSCPAQATEVSFSGNAYLSCNRLVPATVVLCINDSAPLATFGGAFEGDSGNCYQRNPLTGACQCEPGTTPEQFSVLVPDETGTPVPTTLSLCYR